MKVKIRKNVFETNSSSVHTITISKEHGKYNIPEKLVFNVGEFGWEIEEYTDSETKASYLYTALGALYPDRLNKYLSYIKECLSKHNCKAEFIEVNNYSDWYGIDHCELYELIDILMNDEDMLLEYLFGDTTIYTYNDNMDYDNLDFFNDMKRKSNSEKYFSTLKGN